MTGVAKNTIAKLLAELGEACQKFHDDHVRGLSTKRVQCDEIWSFVHCKKANIPAEQHHQLGIGDVWTWTAIDADSKLMIAWHVGKRSGEYAEDFMWDVKERLAGRVQLTSDGHNAYLVAVEEAFQGNVDYAQLQKIYKNDNTSTGRYSPAECIGAKAKPITGNPDVNHINTSYAERANLTMRMGMRRFTRLTNAFSKKIENHKHAIALHFMHYNYCRIHQTLRITPAMAAGLASRVWELEDLVGLLD